MFLLLKLLKYKHVLCVFYVTAVCQGILLVSYFCVLYLVGVVMILGPVDAPVVLLLLVICLVVLVDWTGLRIILWVDCCPCSYVCVFAYW
jgi:hypothetical protein